VKISPAEELYVWFCGSRGGRVAHGVSMQRVQQREQQSVAGKEGAAKPLGGRLSSSLL